MIATHTLTTAYIDSNGTPLRFQHDVGKPTHPGINLVGLAGSMQLQIIGLPVAVDGGDQGGERRRLQTLRQSLPPLC